jgi:exodeoxyribonuclease VII large subunit
MPSPFDKIYEPSAGEPPSGARKTILTIAELTSRIKSVVESSFPFVWVRGEISNFRIPASGHFYFTLKDQTAQIAAVMFRGQARQAKFVPEDGMSVVGLGRLTVYEARGSYQIIIEYIEPAGVGALQIAFENLKRRLADLGVFDARHKKPLPFLPRAISLITSPSGAAVHDLITVITRRAPGIRLRILPVKVQGPGAEEDIVQAFRIANERADSDVIILARGGGSLEDLQAFNSEPVAMAIHRSNIPVVSAVGHETDVTIADFVADLRAPTPSAAGELVAPDKSELMRRCLTVRVALENRMLSRFENIKTRFKELNGRFRDPRKKIQEHWVRLDDITARLARRIRLCMRHERDQLVGLNRHLAASSPLVLLRQHSSQRQVCEQRLLTNMSILIRNKRAAARESAVHLTALNPFAILKRGYSVTRTVPGRVVVTHPDQVEIGAEIETLVAEGRLLSGVKGKSSHGQENL